MKESKEIREYLKQWRDHFYSLVNRLDAEIVGHSHSFSKEEVVSLGWVYKEYYPAGDEYIYSKNNKDIRVPKDDSFDYILTYDGRPMRQILDVEELEDYAK